MIDAAFIQSKLDLLIKSFSRILYEPDHIFMENMKTKNLAGDDISRYQFWEWTQGVGLYGFWQIFSHTGNPEYLNLLTEYYDARIASGLPGKNINTMAPILALSCLGEYQKNDTYLDICAEWAEWAMHGLPRTEEGGFQHITSDSVNRQELWDDTLFMTVLALANTGRILQKQEYIDEAIYQFLLHIKYLTEKKTGLWYHGFTFDGMHNFAGALWGRGNSWAAIAIPVFAGMVDLPPAIHRYLKEALHRLIESFRNLQDPSGMWHTLLDDPGSYLEASASSGIAYAILKSIRENMLEHGFRETAMKALQPILDCIDAEGIVHQVSYGTAMGKESLDFYRTIPLIPMPYGQAMTMLFLLEVLRDLSSPEESGNKRTAREEHVTTGPDHPERSGVTLEKTT